MNGLEVKWVRLAWTESDPKNADGPTMGTGPEIAACTPRATENTAGKTGGGTDGISARGCPPTFRVARGWA